jgi:hypothetical protein
MSTAGNAGNASAMALGGSHCWDSGVQGCDAVAGLVFPDVSKE